jgi:hypothetical protein
MAFFELKKVTVANYRKYPPTTDCSALYKIFKAEREAGVDGGKIKAIKDIKNFKDNATNDRSLI